MEEEERLALQCSSCGTAAREEETRAGTRFGTEADVRVALRRWAKEEGHESADEFAEASFLDGRVDRIYERLREGERIETNFDVLAFLVPEMAMAVAMPGPAREVESGGGGEGGSGGGSGSGGGGEDRGGEAERVTEDGEEAPRLTVTWDGEEEPEEPSALDELRGKVWAPLLPLVSVMVADGRVHPAEEAFLRKFLDANRCPPIPGSYVRVHRPEAVPTPPDARTKERMLEAMVHLVHVDRQRDGSEFRVVEEYARAWGVDTGKVLHWDQMYKRRYATGLRRLWLILQSTMTKR
jgi:hypothetical protein